MHIRLMTYIKHQAVFLCIVDGFYGNSKLNNTQVRSKMPPRFADVRYQKLPYFLTEPDSLFIVQANQIIMPIDTL